MRSHSWWLVCVLSTLSIAQTSSPSAQPAYAQSETIPFTPDRWEIHATESNVIEHLGRPSLMLRGGFAILKDVEALDGTLEFDISFTGDRGFMGAFWRMQDLNNYEEFYVRPHQSGQPDANQYHPIFNGVAGWQLYFGPGYSTPETYEVNQWLHVRILISGPYAEVYFKNGAEPVLVCGLKRQVRAGRVGLSAGDFAPAYYSNFRFTPASNFGLRGKVSAAEVAPPGSVTSWLVSNTVTGKSLENRFQLTPADTQHLTWTPLTAEKNGVANLARIQGIDGERDTVFARIIIDSDKAQVKKVRYGFSDAVRAYLNGTLLYQGQDAYRSRDHRFLGSIGLFDALYVPLQQGRNELWLAVSEGFGGWGVQAVFEDQVGIKIYSTAGAP